MASKKKIRRRVLGASCILAALIVAGASFAWFSSQDEVVNRLSASSDYGVSIVEDFTPPENWIPGQEIEKNVSVVNTGNVDAFVRVWLEGEFNLVTEGNGLAYANAGTPATITDNARLAALGFEEVTVSGTKSYVKLLSTDRTINPNNSNVVINSAEAYSEVQAMQAGGYLAYAPNGAKYKYTLNQNKAVDVYYSASDHAVTDIVSGSVVVVGDNAAAPSSGTYIAPANQAGDIDSDTFLPMTTGLYLFRRDMEVNNGITDKNWEYSGYYYVAAQNDTGGQGRYYALKTKTDASGNDTVFVDSVVLNDGSAPATWYVDQQTGAVTDANALTNVKLFTAEQSKVEDSGITWSYDSGKLTATVSSTANDDAKKLSVDVGLVNVVTNSTADKWHIASPADGDRATKRDTFYYTNDIEEGDTTAQLVDSVTLNQNTKQTAYIAFDFDLNVKMESVQVTVDADENENFASVNPWNSTTKAVAQKATGTPAKEIDTITWDNP